MKLVIYFLCFTFIFCLSRGLTPNELIVNGNDSPVVAHHIHLRMYLPNDDSFNGAGSLITANHVLTVAQNIRDFIRWDIGYGSNIFDELDWMTSSVAFHHEDYMHVNLNNNIGIIVLPQSIIFTEYIGAILLPNDNDIIPIDNQEGFIVGFGYDGENVISPNLQRAYQNVIPIEVCQTFFIHLTMDGISDNHFCAVNDVFASICTGDQGTGFIITDYTDVNILFGLAAFGNGMQCDSGDPTGFVKLTQYTDWIRQHTSLE